STAASPNYLFATEGTFKIVLTVKTVVGSPCASNITRTATSVIKVAKEGPGAGNVPKPNLFSANALGTYISAYAMDKNGQILSGPYDHFDPFPADNAVTAALAMDDKGNFFYLPTFMNGPNPLTATTVAKQGVVEVWAVEKAANKPPVVIASFDMNGASTAELGLFRMGLDQNENAWILAGDGTRMYAARFKTRGSRLVNTSDVTIFPVPFESGSAADFQSGDLAFDNNGNMYVLAGSASGVHIYTMPTNSATPSLAKKWRVTNASGSNFGLSVTGTVFDGDGNMFFSALDGIYYINQSAVNPATGVAVVQKVSENFGLMDLATSQFPAAWTPPFDAVPLPVKLLQFSGVAAADKVNLTWNVAANEKGSHFELEKSTDGKNFKTVGLVFTSEKEGTDAYSFTDVTAVAGKVYYRLKMVSKSGAVAYSNVVFFGGQAVQASTLTLLQNPVSNAVSFQYTATESATAEVAIYTYTGIKIFAQKQRLQKGTNGVLLPLSNVAGKGAYFLEVTEGANRKAVKFIKQ
ncbi:MAG TPA: T9SS type A sorting domain-containing protein, partial [Flavisolibacter sp.]|nr:T9SS type A sorting domain-containing protein [Flavisolibacter sp.]